MKNAAECHILRAKMLEHRAQKELIDRWYVVSTLGQAFPNQCGWVPVDEC